MNAGNLSGAVTVLALVAFLAVVYWAFGAKRKADFDAAARLPLEDELPDVKSSCVQTPDSKNSTERSP
jgi:cytochrome c oxidase cbb3-type subunit IV